MTSLLDDLFSPSKKEKRRMQLSINKERGRDAEDMHRGMAMVRGNALKRTGRGSDFIETERDLFGTVRRTHVEVKSGNARLTPFQRKTKKKKKNYRVCRYDNLF